MCRSGNVFSFFLTLDNQLNGGRGWEECRRWVRIGLKVHYLGRGSGEKENNVLKEGAGCQKCRGEGALHRNKVVARIFLPGVAQFFVRCSFL